MKKLFAVVGLLVALALPSLATAQVPIPVDTGVYDDGVYVQVFTERVFDAETGVAIGREVVGCHVHVWTLHGAVDAVEYESVGETMTATVTTPAAELFASATVKPVVEPGTRDVVAGRAVFTGIAPGAVLVTTNTTPAVVGVCPAS